MPTIPSEADRALLYFRTVIRSNLRNCNAVRANHLSNGTIDSIAMQAAAAVVAAIAEDAVDLTAAPEWATTWAKPARTGLEPA